MKNSVYVVLKCMFCLPFSSVVVKSHRSGRVLMKRHSVLPVLNKYGKCAVFSAMIDFNDLVIEI